MPLPQLTQRQVSERRNRAQNWVSNGATGNGRVDVTAFVAWARACGSEPENALARLPERPSSGPCCPEGRAADASTGPADAQGAPQAAAGGRRQGSGRGPRSPVVQVVRGFRPVGRSRRSARVPRDSGHAHRGRRGRDVLLAAEAPGEPARPVPGVIGHPRWVRETPPTGHVSDLLAHRRLSFPVGAHPGRTPEEALCGAVDCKGSPGEHVAADALWHLCYFRTSRTWPLVMQR
jgi:hypothetical protein